MDILVSQINATRDKPISFKPRELRGQGKEAIQLDKALLFYFRNTVHIW